MKVLKTPLGKQVLADAKATEQLRRFMASRTRDGGAVIELRTRDGTLRLKPELVPKAA